MEQISGEPAHWRIKAIPFPPDLTTSAFQKTSERLSGRYYFISHTSPEWRLDSKNFARKWRKNIAVRMEGSEFSRLESIHEWCDFEESMILKQDRSRSCSWRIRIGLGRQARRFKSHTQDAATLNEHRHSSKYQECDKKTSQLTGFFYLCWTFLKLFCIVTNCIPCRLGTNINMKLYSYLRVIIQAVNLDVEMNHSLNQFPPTKFRNSCKKFLHI